MQFFKYYNYVTIDTTHFVEIAISFYIIVSIV